MADATFTRDAAAWHPILAKRFDLESPRIKKLHGYMLEDGGSPVLPEGASASTEAWTDFQKISIQAVAPLIVSAFVNRIKLNEVRVGDDRADDEKIIRKMIRGARLETCYADVAHAMGVVGTAYVQNSVGPNGEPIATAEDRRFVICSVDPLFPQTPRAALKVWRDPDMGMDYSFVWDGTNRVKFERKSSDANVMITKVEGGGWTQVESVPVDGVPFVVFNLDSTGMGAFEAHIGMIDRLNYLLLTTITAIAQQAFAQRLFTGGLPTHNEAGEVISYNGMFSAALGGIWDLPPGVSIEQLAAVDPRPMIEACREAAKDLAAATGTPYAAIDPAAGANQSAEGAKATDNAIYFRTTSIIERNRSAYELVIVRMINTLDAALLGEDTVTATFASPTRITDNERAAAVATWTQAGMAFRSAAALIGGFDADTVDRMVRELDEQRMDEASYAAPVLTFDEMVSAMTVMERIDAHGAAVRATVTPESARKALQLDGFEFTGDLPVTTRPAE